MVERRGPALSKPASASRFATTGGMLPEAHYCVWTGARPATLCNLTVAIALRLTLRATSRRESPLDQEALHTLFLSRREPVFTDLVSRASASGKSARPPRGAHCNNPHIVVVLRLPENLFSAWRRYEYYLSHVGHCE